MVSTVESLTYKELAERLGVKLPSARQTVSRHRWKRVKGNDGQVRIEVPTDYLQRHDEAASEAGSETASVPASVDILVENAALKVERDYLNRRIEDLQSDRDRWHQLATRPWWKRMTG